MSLKQLKVLRALCTTALISLLLGAVLTAMNALFDTFYSVLLGVGAVLVTLYCYHRADQTVVASREYYFWRYIPTLVFVFGPLIFMVLTVTEGEWTVSDWLLLLRFGATFVLPIACLLATERLLRQAVVDAGDPAQP